jgi:pimeloyl-ACP methyl ester carboxylesterase
MKYNRLLTSETTSIPLQKENVFMMLHPYKIEIADPVLDDLRERLTRTRLPENDDRNWEDGIDLTYLQELITYWRDQFDWKAQEEKLNRFNQLRGSVDGTTVHVIHEQGNGPAPLPIVLAHGWPDSPFRFNKLIPMLTNPGAHGGDPADAFHVVAPSLPGYGFSLRDGSYGSSIFGFGSLLNAVMRELGYERYGAHGGDIGNGAIEMLVANHPQALIGVHLTDTLPFFRTPPSDLSQEERAYLQGMERFQYEEGAYVHLQGTKPWTPAAALMDSPAGLAAWIVEKFQAWSDCGGDIESRFSKDELLTNVMLYWVTGTIGSSFLAYRDFMKARTMPAAQETESHPGKAVRVPTGFAIFAKDFFSTPPRSWAERFYDVQRWTEVPTGGHFAALEEPERLAEEIRAFFRPLRK